MVLFVSVMGGGGAPAATVALYVFWLGYRAGGGSTLLWYDDKHSPSLGRACASFYQNGKVILKLTTSQ